MEKKESYASQVKGNKIVFLSGSNTLFGIRSKDVEDYFGIPSVNLAVHYGLQIDYMLNRARRVLRSGDLVILPLEYSHYTYDGSYSIIQSFYIRTYDREYFKSLPLLKQLKHLINTTPLDFAKSVNEQLSFEGKEPPLGSGVYNSRTLNKNGDETYGEDPRYDRLDRAQPFAIPTVLEETYGMQKIKEFSLWCAENGIEMYITWPNTMCFDAYEEDAYEKFFKFIIGYLSENKVKYIGDYRQFFFQKEYFYDGPYHLNQQAITIRTKMLIDIMENDLALLQRLR